MHRCILFSFFRSANKMNREVFVLNRSLNPPLRALLHQQTNFLVTLWFASTEKATAIFSPEFYIFSHFMCIDWWGALYKYLRPHIYCAIANPVSESLTQLYLTQLWFRTRAVCCCARPWALFVGALLPCVSTAWLWHCCVPQASQIYHMSHSNGTTQTLPYVLCTCAKRSHMNTLGDGKDVHISCPEMFSILWNVE